MKLVTIKVSVERRERVDKSCKKFTTMKLRREELIKIN